MSESIVTKGKLKDNDGNVLDERSAETNSPRVLQTDVTLQELVEAVGEDYVKSKTQAQFTIDFRSKVRTQILKLDDNGDYSVSIEEIESQDYTDWAPELKQRKSAEEKAAETIDKLNADQKQAVLAKLGLA